MNVFALDYDPAEAAKALNDWHIRKMYIEGAQVLSAALWLAGVKNVAFDAKLWLDSNRWDTAARKSCHRAYGVTHVNHPAARWATGQANYMWLLEHSMAICFEFCYRFGSVPRTILVLEQLPTWENAHGPIKFGQYIEESCKQLDPIQAYRQYYRTSKSHLATWTKRPKPEWFND